MLKILIADDHPIVRKGLKDLLQEEFASAYIGEAVDCPTLVTKAKEEEWSIVISDLSMPGGGGLEALKQIKRDLPQLPVLILSSQPEVPYADKMIREGASGYLNKDAAAEKLIDAMKCILEGRIWRPGEPTS
jgi:two-component system, NarL family, invasion response regulator UvrY